MSQAQLAEYAHVLDMRYRNHEITVDAYTAAMEDIKLCQIRAMRARQAKS